MAKIAFIDDMPEADEAFVRAHRAELLALAEELGITDVRVAHTGRMVGSIHADSAPLGVYAFSARASSLLEHVVRMHDLDVTQRANASEDLQLAVPL